MIDYTKYIMIDKNLSRSAHPTTLGYAMLGYATLNKLCYA